jgi:uncharacterized protein YndB with AHSA1/START domain
MVDVTTEILIAAPCKTVAEYAADPDNAPEWYQNIASARWETPPPLAVGSRIAFDAAFLGRHLSYTYEIVEFRPREKLVMRTAQGPSPMQTTYTWTEVDGATTRMTLRNNGEPAGFSRLAAPFIGMMMRKANRKDLVRIKSILEVRPTSA